MALQIATNKRGKDLCTYRTLSFSVESSSKSDESVGRATVSSNTLETQKEQERMISCQESVMAGYGYLLD